MDMQKVSELTYLYEILNNEPVSSGEQPKPIKRVFIRGVVVILIITLVLIGIA